MSDSTFDNTFIVFKAYDTLFAINSESFRGIAKTGSEENIVPLTGMGRGVVGFTSLRNSPAVLVDLREYLKLPSVTEQYKKLAEVIEQKRCEQMECFVELKKCSYLEIPPTQWAIDSFYGFKDFLDSFETEREDLKTHFRHLAKNYSKLREKSDMIFSPDTDADTKKRLLYEVQYFYIPKVLKLIEEAKSIALENFREVVVLISCGEINAGLIADEVTSVEKINLLMGEQDARKIFAVPYIAGVGKGEKTESEIILLSAQKLSEELPTPEQIYKAIKGEDDK